MAKPFFHGDIYRNIVRGSRFMLTSARCTTVNAFYEHFAKPVVRVAHKNE